MDCKFELRFSGALADRNLIQFYDVAHALWGFERAVSITTHLLINGKVITQSPSAKGFSLVVPPPEEGSWKLPVILGLGSTIGAFGLAPPDTMFGWLAKSAVEYVIEETLGFEPDFDETLGNQIEQFRETESSLRLPDDLSQSRFDSVIEKCENGLRAIHRPIVYSSTAEIATVNWRVGSSEGQFDGYFDEQTHEYISKTVTQDDIEEFRGYVSSYNSNTFSGRLYLPPENRTVPFKLNNEAVSVPAIQLITTSLRSNAIARGNNTEIGDGDIILRGFRNASINGRLKSIGVVEVLAYSLL